LIFANASIDDSENAVFASTNCKSVNAWNSAKTNGMIEA
jgi:hypothetical protein